MNFLKKLFGIENKKIELPKQEFTDEEFEKDYQLKELGLENILGKMYGIVGHAIIPFSIGGGVDMYYFPHHIPGTGFATMELLDPLGNGPKQNRLGTYELVAFTKLSYNEDNENQNNFNLIERRFCEIFTTIGNYSFQAVLNPNETIEVPNGTKKNNCLILEEYNPEEKEFKIGERKHHLLLCLEVFRNEMEFARKRGVPQLIELLKEKGFYPYSDLDRDSVV